MYNCIQLPLFMTIQSFNSCFNNINVISNIMFMIGVSTCFSVGAARSLALGCLKLLPKELMFSSSSKWSTMTDPKQTTVLNMLRSWSLGTGLNLSQTFRLHDWVPHGTIPRNNSAGAATMAMIHAPWNLSHSSVCWHELVITVVTNHWLVNQPLNKSLAGCKLVCLCRCASGCC